MAPAMTAPITVVSIKHMDGNGATKAFADVAIGGVTVHGVRVIDAGKGPFLGMPSSKGKDGKWHDHVTLSKPLAEKVREIVLSAWRGQPPEGEEPSSRPGGQSTPPSRRDGLQGAAFGQRRIDELAAEFDRRGPDTEIPF
jgi:DNA-binding cell septation regulator SpoVG